MTAFARAFVITAPDRDDLDGRHGVQLPSGYCVLDIHGGLGLDMATSMERLDLPDGAVVEWADGTTTTIGATA